MSIGENQQESDEDIFADLQEDLTNAWRSVDEDAGVESYDDDEEDEEESDHPADDPLAQDPDDDDEEETDEDDEEEEDDEDESEDDAEEADEEDESEEEVEEEEAEEVEASDDSDESDRLDLPALRKRYRDSSKEVKRLTRELEEANERASVSRRYESQSALLRPDPKIEEARKEADEYSASQLLEYVARVQAGDADGQFRAKALQLLEFKSPEELTAVIQDARRGSYGNLSREVELAASEQLPVVQAIQHRDAAQNQARVQWQEQNMSCLREVIASEVEFLPDGKLDLTHESSKAYEKAGEELLAAMPNLADNANAPTMVLEYMRLKNKAALADKVPELEAEVARLQKMVGKKTKSIPRGKRPKKRVTGSNLSAEEQLAQDLKAFGVQSD